MSALVNFFGDNAMFYKDITQWMRNRTFASLFFGLLLVAEALSLFIIAGSDDISNPGVSMFYTLYLVLIIYALLIAYMGNGLTSREFVNRTFELFELSGMSLERMVGGKILSMLYQFFFGFFCLVPFMFFAYFLGGLDFFEMLVGVVMAGFMALPLYLVSLLSALTGRFKQIALLARLGAVFALGMFILFAAISFFANQPIMQEIVSDLTDFFKRLFGGSAEALVIFVVSVAIYVQACLLLFYFCCDSISRESDSREIPIKVLTGSLILCWMFYFGYKIVINGYEKGVTYLVVVPVFLALLALGVRTFYNRAAVPPIVARRYRGATGFRRILYVLFRPGIEGSLRTLLLLILLSVAAGQIAVMLLPTGFGSADLAAVEWWSGMSLLVQIPWFLAIPHVFFARARDMRYNYAGQRTITVAWWVVLGALVLIYLAWTHSSVLGNSSAGFLNIMDILLITLLSPLPSLSVVGSSEVEMQVAGGYVRMAAGLAGAVLMWHHMRRAVRDEADMIEDAAGAGPAGGVATADVATEPILDDTSK